MRILRIEIEEFGKLRNLLLEPAEGLTLIEGENESGKSTLLAFLRFAFYGFPRKGGPDGDERDKRLSWEGKRAAGQLTLESGGERYRIVRRAYLRGSAAREAINEELSVVRLSDGAAVSLNGKHPGEYFLGLPYELYEGSLYLTQGGADRVATASVGEAVGDLLFMGEGAFSAQSAEQKLAAAHRELRHLKGRGGRIAELEDRLAELDRTLSQGKDDAARLLAVRAEIQTQRQAMEALKKELAEVSAALECNEIDRTLSLFDDKNAAVAEEARCRAALESAEHEAPQALRDSGFVERVAQLLRRYLDARATVLRLTPEVTALKAVKIDEGACEVAARIEALGGAERVMERMAQKRSRAGKSAATGVFFAVLAAVCGLLFVWLSDWRLYAVIGGGVFALATVICFWIALRNTFSRKALLHELNVPPKGRMRTYFEKVRNDAALAQSHGERLAVAEGELLLARQNFSLVDSELECELADVGRADLYGSPEAITDFLEALSHERAVRGASLREAAAALERAVGVTEMLTRRLQGIDEAALRTRRAMLPAVKRDTEDCRGRLSVLQGAIADGERSLTELQRREAALAATATDPLLQSRERETVAAELAAAQGRLAAVQLAQEAMEQATDELRRSVTPRLAVAAAEIFDRLSDGAHGALRISPEFTVTLEDGGIPRPLSHFSAGCLDAACLSLRLALLDMIADEPLPLFFDEALSRLDDNRARALLSAIASYCRRGGQCLLFTCHSREGRLLEGTPGVKRFSMAGLQ